jgi:hypothetical protein
MAPMTHTLPPQPHYRIGLISDTHGHLPARAADIFRGADIILHAGDIGGEEILDALAEVSRVVAVRGNMDWGPWADRLPESARVHAGDLEVHLVHDRLRFAPPEPHRGALALVSGHTHRAAVERQNGILHINPGSAGQPRHGRGATVALLRVRGASAEAEIIELLP